MDTELLERWAEMAQNAWKPYIELTEITTRSLERAGRRQLEFFRETLEEGARYGRDLSETKDPKALLELQSRLVSGYGERLFAFTKENVELCLETGNEVGQWLQSSAALPAEPAPRARKTSATA